MLEFLAFVLGFACIGMFSIWIGGGDPFAWLKPFLKNYQRIHIKCSSTYIDDFETFTRVDAEGNPIGACWKHPTTKTGSVKLNSNGTGSYIGDITWVKLP